MIISSFGAELGQDHVFEAIGTAMGAYDGENGLPVVLRDFDGGTYLRWGKHHLRWWGCGIKRHMRGR